MSISNLEKKEHTMEVRVLILPSASTLSRPFPKVAGTDGVKTNTFFPNAATTH